MAVPYEIEDKNEKDKRYVDLKRQHKRNMKIAILIWIVLLLVFIGWAVIAGITGTNQTMVILPSILAAVTLFIGPFILGMVDRFNA